MGAFQECVFLLQSMWKETMHRRLTVPTAWLRRGAEALPCRLETDAGMGAAPPELSGFRRLDGRNDAMNAYLASVIENVKRKHGNEP